MKTFEELPGHLSERCRWIVARPYQTNQPFVLYWMRTAIRTDENPALDVARHLAAYLGKPLLVYQGLSQRYPYASDRHHTFIMQGARDVQASFQQLEIPYIFHLERPGEDSNYLRQLAQSAAVVVTEEMPTRPALSFLQSVTTRASYPVMAVDTACIVPMQSLRQAYTRAYAYRDATWDRYQQRVRQPWPKCDVSHPASHIPTLPLTPLNLLEGSLADWIAQCDIDHTIGPVLDTFGGSTAGYARWNQFCQNKLRKYDRQRNDPLTDGVSRMSAYLHYGMVSPFRIAREAVAISGTGAEKFLDELLIWRELAYVFCFHQPDHERWSALPEWARRTLELHAKDRRPVVYSWEELARGATNDPLWNAAQRSLLIHGELHNNVRMTWGKAILNWTSDPKQALAMMIDLNHRYALDGRDPASYGGLLWCLGQFDRPFEPEQPIFGTIRPRQTQEHARRLNVQKYSIHTSTSRSALPPSIAILGTGMAAAMAARTLVDHGLQVTLFRESRQSDEPPSKQSFIATQVYAEGTALPRMHPLFARYVSSWVQQGLMTLPCSDWSPVEKHLLSGGVEQPAVEVLNWRKNAAGFEVLDATGQCLGSFDRLILSTAFGQATEPLWESQPCWNHCWMSPDERSIFHQANSNLTVEEQFSCGCAMAGRMLATVPVQVASPKQGLLF